MFAVHFFSQISKNVSVADAIMEFGEGVLTVYGPNETASIFATYPSQYLTLGRSFLDQVRVYQNQAIALLISH